MSGHRRSRPYNKCNRTGRNTTSKSNNVLTSLNCIYTNATSLNGSKRCELEATVAEEQPHLVFVSETWFGPDSAPNIPGYELMRQDRGSRGGGVAIYAHRKIEAAEVSDLRLRTELASATTLEATWCEIHIGNERVIAGCIYRPPTSSTQTDDEIINCLTCLASALEEKRITGTLVAGDFNLPAVSWADGYPCVRGNERSPGARLVDALEDLFLVQGVSAPTFTRANGDEKNALDLVIYEADSRVDSINHGPGLSTTKQQHQLLRWSYRLNCELKMAAVLPRPNYAKGDYRAMNEHFAATDWETTLGARSFQDAYDLLVNIIKEAERQHIPMTSRKDGKSAPWLNSELKALIKEKRSLWQINRACGGKDTVKSERYRVLVKSIRSKLVSAVNNYELELANDKKNPKRIYHYIRMRQKTKPGLELLQEAEGVVTSRAEIASTMNVHFASCFVVEPPTEDEHLPDFAARTTASITDCLVTITDIEQRLKALDAHKSPGGDGMHAAVFKECAGSLAVPLAHLFRRSLDESNLPSSWLEANVTPIYKKGSRASKENYRPISLTSVV